MCGSLGYWVVGVGLLHPGDQSSNGLAVAQYSEHLMIWPLATLLGTWLAHAAVLPGGLKGWRGLRVRDVLHRVHVFMREHQPQGERADWTSVQEVPVQEDHLISVPPRGSMSTPNE